MSPRFMLDTDIASYIIKGTRPQLDQRLATIPPSDVCISSITRGELLYGVHLRPAELRLARPVEQFLTGVASLPWDEAAADTYGRIAAELHVAGRRIGPFDTMIAAHALALDLTMVTNNIEHFSRVNGLRLDNWQRQTDAPECKTVARMTPVGVQNSVSDQATRS